MKLPGIHVQLDAMEAHLPRRTGRRCVRIGLRAAVLLLALPPAIPAPRDHSFWATAREDFERKQWQKRSGKAWKSGVPFSQGSLSHRGGDVHGSLSRWDDDDGPRDREYLTRKLGHAKGDEDASHSWSAPRFGPSMLLSGEAAIRHRPAPEPEEEDRLNAVRQRQVYLGQSLAPEDFAHNVRKLKEQFDKRHSRPGAPGRDEDTRCDRNELFESMLSERLSGARSSVDGSRKRSFPCSRGAKDKHGPAAWLAEDARQEAMAEQMWSQAFAAPPALAEQRADAECRVASEHGKFQQTRQDSPGASRTPLAKPGGAGPGLRGNTRVCLGLQDSGANRGKPLAAQPQEHSCHDPPLNGAEPTDFAGGGRAEVTPEQAFAMLRRRKARGVRPLVAPPAAVAPSGNALYGNLSQPAATRGIEAPSLCKNQTGVESCPRREEDTAAAPIDVADAAWAPRSPCPPCTPPSFQPSLPRQMPEGKDNGEASDFQSETSCSRDDGAAVQGEFSRDDQEEAPVGTGELQAWIAARYCDAMPRKQGALTLPVRDPVSTSSQPNSTRAPAQAEGTKGAMSGQAGVRSPFSSQNGSAWASGNASHPQTASASPAPSAPLMDPSPIQKGSRCWYLMRTDEGSTQHVEVQVISVDYTVQPPSYAIAVRHGHNQLSPASLISSLIRCILQLSNLM